MTHIPSEAQQWFVALAILDEMNDREVEANVLLGKSKYIVESPYFVIWPFSTVFEILLGVSFFGFAHSTFRWQSRPSEGPQSAVDQNTNIMI